jgi:hypothetical protein
LLQRTLTRLFAAGAGMLDGRGRRGCVVGGVGKYWVLVCLDVFHYVKLVERRRAIDPAPSVVSSAREPLSTSALWGSFWHRVISPLGAPIRISSLSRFDTHTQQQCLQQHRRSSSYAEGTDSWVRDINSSLFSINRASIAHAEQRTCIHASPAALVMSLNSRLHVQ